jgi:hypothetical protein
MVPALVAAGLLAFGGAQKLIDPTMTVGALRVAGLPGGPRLVRAGAAAELALGVLAIVAGGPVVWLLAALSYAAFAIFVGSALARDLPIGSCGCFGRTDTPPHPVHVLLNAALAAVAVTAALALDRAPLDELTDRPGDAVIAAALALLGLAAAYSAFVRLPLRRPAGPVR